MLSIIVFLALGLWHHAKAQTSPNIVFIMTDDQDRRLGSTDYMPILQEKIAAKGVEFTNHYTTQALCCPSRSSLLRGQATHNTNITNVVQPGGSYNKWVLSGQDTNYLPHWLKQAGYRSEYIGKIMNGFGISNFNVTVKGWDWTDLLVEPYIDDFNLPVLSQNGETPVFYDGFHQSDVIRIKALDRLDSLANQSDPFFLAICPFTPHVGYQQDKPSHRPIPLQRHLDLFPNASAPRTPNFNPDEEYQQNAGGWVKWLLPMNDSAVNMADFVYRSRLQALQGIDEIVDDVVAKLDAQGILNNTYIIYTSDNGYHLGQHRMPGGKSLFYNEDTNIPFFVRGPGIPENKTSTIPGMHLDLAPTFLDIAGLAEDQWPEFFDGRSLLDAWKSPESTSASITGESAGQGNSKESIGVEYWGKAGIEAPSAGELGSPFLNTTYKTVRIIGDEQAWVYTVWCNGDKELYNTADDPYEITNLAATNASANSRVLNRLNALLMVVKSCEQNACRDPWSLLTPNNATLTSLTQALNADYDTFFEDFDQVTFGTCLTVQSIENEAPFFPALDTLATGGLAQAYRNATDVIAGAPGVRAFQTANYYGTEAQRNATLSDMTAASRALTTVELDTV
ncbi:arylsulfatase [Xylariaceae sp. FL0804]|nr:arylsulfatase [Xylariaceae sp. FL0804]